MNESRPKNNAATAAGNSPVDGNRADYCRIADIDSGDAQTGDVDDLLRSIRTLQAREAQLNPLTETLPALIWSAAADGRIIYMNKMATAYCGRTIEEVQRDGWIDLVHPDDYGTVTNYWKHLREEGIEADFVLRFLGVDGRYKWFNTIATSVRDESGKITALHSIMLDYTAQKNAELGLQPSERQMQRMMDTVPSMLWSIAPDGNVTFVNRQVRDYTGLSLDQIRQRGWIELVHPNEHGEVTGLCKETLASGSHCRAERRIRRVDGIYRCHMTRVEPLRDGNGQIVQWFVLDIDIDDQKRAEERLRALRTSVSDTSKASIAAEISASIAHEINQPLSSVLVNAQACARWLKGAPPRIEEAVTSVDRIVRDARAVDAVLRNVRSIFKKQIAVKTPCNIVGLIQDAVGLIREDSIRCSIPITFDFGDPILTVFVDRLQIQQVIINVVGNAIEAMQGSGRLPSLRIRAGKTADGQILIEFIDNGCGLPAQSTESIFDAFVTSKTNGMGIGLSISRSIVEAHGGRLWAENNPEFGAKFTLLLRSPFPDIASE